MNCLCGPNTFLYTSLDITLKRMALVTVGVTHWRTLLLNSHEGRGLNLQHFTWRLQKISSGTKNWIHDLTSSTVFQKAPICVETTCYNYALWPGEMKIQLVHLAYMICNALSLFNNFSPKDLEVNNIIPRPLSYYDYAKFPMKARSIRFSSFHQQQIHRPSWSPEYHRLQNSCGKCFWHNGHLDRQVCQIYLSKRTLTGPNHNWHYHKIN